MTNAYDTVRLTRQQHDLLAGEVQRLRRKLEEKERERQYHMNQINRLASALMFWDTSEAIVDHALTIIRPAVINELR